VASTTPTLGSTASLMVIQCIRMHSLLKYGTLLTMQLTWVFSLVDSACNLRNGISGSEPGQDLVVLRNSGAGTTYSW
jgi:hypothetical protein